MNTCPTALIVDKDTHSGTLSARNFVSMFRSLSLTCSRCWFSRSRR